jgi:hypothetical protein
VKGTLISIIIGALAGVLLTLGTNVHASRATANGATPTNGSIVTPAHAPANPDSHLSEPPAAPDEQAPLAK